MMFIIIGLLLTLSLTYFINTKFNKKKEIHFFGHHTELSKTEWIKDIFQMC